MSPILWQNPLDLLLPTAKFFCCWPLPHFLCGANGKQSVLPWGPVPLHVHTETNTHGNWSIPHASVLRDRGQHWEQSHSALKAEPRARTSPGHIPVRQELWRWGVPHGCWQDVITAPQGPTLLLCSVAGPVLWLALGNPVSPRCRWVLGLQRGSAAAGHCWAPAKTHLAMLVQKIWETSYFLPF